MEGEVRLRWEAFVTQPVFKRFAKYATEPRTLFECIGEDLASSDQEVREIAYWALVHAMPKLTSVYYQWEIRQPGWSDKEGKDQRIVKRGMDILSDLHLKLVEGHRFKVGGEYGKDPRPFVNQEIKYKERDERRKSKREMLLDDYDDILEIPNPAPSIEDSVIEKISLADPEKEFLPLRMIRDEGKRALLKTVLLDESLLNSVQEDLGIAPKDNTVRQQFSRARKDATADRDALFTYLLIMGMFPINGELPQFPKNPEMAERADIVIRSIRPGVWLNGLSADGKNFGAVRSLTRRYNGAPAHLYLVAIHKEYISALYTEYIEKRPFHNGRGEFFEPRCDPLTLDNQGCLKYVDKLIDPKSRELCQSHYMYSLLGSYPTEVSGLNSALTDIRGDYGIWLLSNSVPDSRRIHDWTYGKSAGELSLRERKQRDAKRTKLYSRCLLSPSRIYSMILGPTGGNVR